MMFFSLPCLRHSGWAESFRALICWPWSALVCVLALLLCFYMLAVAIGGPVIGMRCPRHRAWHVSCGAGCDWFVTHFWSTGVPGVTSRILARCALSSPAVLIKPSQPIRFRRPPIINSVRSSEHDSHWYSESSFAPFLAVNFHPTGDTFVRNAFVVVLFPNVDSGALVFGAVSFAHAFRYCCLASC